MPYIGRGPAKSGAFRILDDVSGDFNGSTVTFALTVASTALTVGLPETLIIAVDGVIQEPGSAYTISGSNIVFTAAPQTDATFWGVELGDVGGLADRATTQSANDNTTKIATTAYVQTELGAYAADTATFTNKTFDVEATGNSVSNIDVANLKSGVLDIDISSVSGSDDTLASAKAIKTYVDAQVDTEDTLAEMGDVNLTSPADAAILVYDTATSRWRDAAVSGDATIGDTGAVTVASSHSGSAHHAASHTAESHSDITASGAELNKLDGASANVTAANLNILTDSSSTTALHAHAASSPAFIGCRLSKSGNQTVSGSSGNFITEVTWEGTDHFDTDTMHDTSTNNNRITINTAGVYHFGCFLPLSSASDGGRKVEIIVGSNIYEASWYATADGSGDNRVSVAGMYNMTTSGNTSYITVRYSYYGTDSNQRIYASGATFWAYRVGSV